MKCVLNSLKSYKVKGLLPFLTPETFELLPKKFSCCKGESIRLQNKDDEERQVFLRCPLKERLFRLHTLKDCFERTNGTLLNPNQLEQKEFNLYWTWFIHNIHKNIGRGLDIETKTKHLAWAIAAMGIWRFGLNCFVYQLSKHSVTDFISYVSSLDPYEASPIIFFEVEDGPISLHKREECAYFFSWCEKHLAPLWLINQSQKKDIPPFNPNSKNILKQYQRIIQREKERPFKDNLSAECLSKLSTLTVKVRKDPTKKI